MFRHRCSWHCDFIVASQVPNRQYIQPDPVLPISDLMSDWYKHHKPIRGESLLAKASPPFLASFPTPNENADGSTEPEHILNTKLRRSASYMDNDAEPQQRTQLYAP